MKIFGGHEKMPSIKNEIDKLDQEEAEFEKRNQVFQVNLEELASKKEAVRKRYRELSSQQRNIELGVESEKGKQPDLLDVLSAKVECIDEERKIDAEANRVLGDMENDDALFRQMIERRRSQGK